MGHCKKSGLCSHSTVGALAEQQQQDDFNHQTTFWLLHNFFGCFN